MPPNSTIVELMPVMGRSHCDCEMHLRYAVATKVLRHIAIYSAKKDRPHIPWSKRTATQRMIIAEDNPSDDVLINWSDIEAAIRLHGNRSSSKYFAPSLKYCRWGFCAQGGIPRQPRGRLPTGRL